MIRSTNRKEDTEKFAPIYKELLHRANKINRDLATLLCDKQIVALEPPSNEIAPKKIFELKKRCGGTSVTAKGRENRFAVKPSIVEPIESSSQDEDPSSRKTAEDIEF